MNEYINATPNPADGRATDPGTATGEQTGCHTVFFVIEEDDANTD